MARKTDDSTIVEMLKQGKTQKEIAEYFNVSPAAICKRVKRILPPDPPESFKKLTRKEQGFVLQIARGSNQVQAAANSFDVTSLDSAKSIGSELMRKDDIKKAISDLLDEVGLTRRYGAEKMKLHTDNKDPNISLKSIDMMWKLRGLYTEHHVHHVVSYSDLVKERREVERQIREEKVRILREMGKNREADTLEAIEDIIEAEAEEVEEDTKESEEKDTEDSKG